MSKNIVLFIDGTWNAADPADPGHSTNVAKLHDACIESPSQVVLYLPGVGSDHPAKPDNPGVLEKTESFLKAQAGGLTGYGTSHRIRKAYQFLSGNYESGDRIYLFGFSRGAFAARSLAGFADKVGLLLHNAAKDEYVDAAWYIYEHGRDKRNSLVRAFLRDIVDEEQPRAEQSVLPVHFIGVWDTVAAQGLPSRAKILTARFTEYHQTELPPNITHARHALSLHELRREFEPLLWSIRSHEGQSLIQKWFAGAHSDVGGSYPETNWSDVALGWMTLEAWDNELQLKRSISGACRSYTVPIHQENDGFKAYYPIAVRNAIAARQNLSEVTRDSYQVDPCAIDRIFKAPKYDFETRYVERLKEVDDFTLQMEVDLRLRFETVKAQQSGIGVVAPDWLKTLRVVDFSQANERAATFLENRRAVVTLEVETGLKRSIGAMCLANDTARLRDFARAVFDASQTEEAVPIPDDPWETDPVSVWVGSACAIVDGALACTFLLPEGNRAEVREAFSAAEKELSDIQSARRIERYRRRGPIRLNPRE